MNSSERYHGLDFVRAVAMMLGVVLHTCMLFRDDLHFPMIAGEYRGDAINTFAVKFIHFFRMQLFMILAGFFAELVFQRKGMNHLAQDRIKRILIPFLMGIFIFVPIIGFLTNFNPSGAYINLFDQMSWYEKCKSYFLWGLFSDKPAMPKIFFMHFWFIYFLIFYYIMHWGFNKLGNKDFIFNNSYLSRSIKFLIKYKWGFIALSILAFPIHYSLQSPMFWPSHFNFQINEMIYYFGFYIFGAYLYKNILLLKALAKHCWFYLFLSLPFVFILNEPTTKHDLMRSVVVDITSWEIANISLWEEGIFANGLFKAVVVFLRCAVSWTLCLGFIGLAHRYLSKSNIYVRYLADSAYWVFWIHIIFTIYLGRIGQEVTVGYSLVKAVLVIYLSLFFMYSIYNNCVRYTFLGDYFMGRRKSPNHPDEINFTIFRLMKKSSPICILILLISGICSYLNETVSLSAKNDALVESFVPRNQSVLKKYNSLSVVSDKYGRNPLHIASKFPEGLRRYNPIPILLEKAVKVDGIDLIGRSPLFYAVRTGNLKDAGLLIEAGADINLSDKYGHTPAHVAAIKTGLDDQKKSDHFLKILKSLKEKGANMSAQDYRGRTVLDCLNFFGKRKLE